MKSATVSIFSPSICHKVMGQDAMVLVFWILIFKPAFSLSFTPLSRGSLVPLHFLPLGWYGGTSGEESACQCRRPKKCRFDPWVRKIPWRGSGNPLQYSCLRMLWTEESGRLQSVGSQNWMWLTQLSKHTSAYLRLLIFLLVILIPACDSSSLAFRMPGL